MGYTFTYNLKFCMTIFLLMYFKLNQHNFLSASSFPFITVNTMFYVGINQQIYDIHCWSCIVQWVFNNMYMTRKLVFNEPGWKIF